MDANTPSTGGRGNRRQPVWQLNCLALCTLIGVALSADELEQLVMAHACPCLARRLHEDRGFLLHVAHKTAHDNNAFSRELMTQLDDKYRDEVAWTRGQPTASIQDQLPAMALDAIAMPGILWALLSDADENRQQLGERIVHAMQHRAMAALELRPIAIDDNDTEPSQTDDLTGWSRLALQRKVQEQASVIDHMLAYIDRTRAKQINHEDSQP